MTDDGALVEKVRAWVCDVAYSPDDFVLGSTGLDADGLRDLHALLDAVDPEWRKVFKSRHADK